VRTRIVLDLGGLPQGMGTVSLTWWGTLVFMLLEGTGFALVLAIYLYLGSLASAWPINAPPPDLLPGSLVTVVLLVSAISNLLISRWAAQGEIQGRWRRSRWGSSS
jgi:cytochrome c oxidase subunit III